MRRRTWLRSLIRCYTFNDFRRAFIRDRSGGWLIGRGFDEFLNLDTPVRVQNNSQAGCIFFIFLAGVDRKHAGDLSEDTNSMNRIDIFYRVAIAVTILEQECPNVRLTTLDHVLNCSNYNRITDNKSLVKPGKEWPSRDRECENLGVYFRDG